MNRSEFLTYAGLFTANAAFFPALPRFDPSPFTTLRNNTGIFSMQGGTIGWFTSDDTIVAVDSQFPDSASVFLNGITGFGSGPEKILINTHHHGDHTGGNKLFEENHYHIIAHEHVPENQRRAARANNAETSQAYARTTFSDRLQLSIAHETITAAYYGAAHTNGDSVIWFENANIAHMGDLVFNRRYPFIDRNGGALITGWIDLLGAVYAEADRETLFIFGHANPEFGVTGNRDDLMVMRDFLAKLLEHTHQAIQAGHSREEITQLQQFDEFPDFESPGDFLSLPRNLDAAYQELTAEN